VTDWEWLMATDPTPMLRFLWDKASSRKLRLFVCGCCYRIWHLIPVQSGQAAVRTAESYADTNTDYMKLSEIKREVVQSIQNAPAPSDSFIRSHAVRSPLQAAAYAASISLPALEATNGAKWAVDAVGWSSLNGMPSAVARRASRWKARKASAEIEERKAQASLMRCIFGNPFRPVTATPSWLTSTVVDLAEYIYKERAFERLPILADALMDAGCDNEDVLNHCRSEGPHCRGCWPVDLLTGRK
jgi:hypothetical protein